LQNTFFVVFCNGTYKIFVLVARHLQFTVGENFTHDDLDQVLLKFDDEDYVLSPPESRGENNNLP